MSHPPRRAKRTLNIVTAVYVVIGFCVAVPAAATGNRLNAFLGFLIISGALAAAAVIAPVLRVVARLGAIDDHLRDLRKRFRRIEATDSTGDAPTRSEPATQTVDLACFGPGDPSVLTAATLERDVFPRLVTTMDKSPPASADLNSDIVNPNAAEQSIGGNGNVRCEAAEPFAGLTSLSLLRQWKLGLRTGDLAMCRGVYSALVDLVDATTLESLRTPLNELTDRVEVSLRRDFARHAHQHDLAALAEVGREIIRLLPQRPIAAEFRRIDAQLRRRLCGRDVGDLEACQPVGVMGPARELGVLR